GTRVCIGHQIPHPRTRPTCRRRAPRILGNRRKVEIGSARAFCASSRRTL
ncbi:uncharacterized protein METZ01_LOCUS426626, partial [marine metagenome]